MRIALLLVSIFSATLCVAQLDRGTFLVGGTASFERDETESGPYNSSKYTTVSISPITGVFVIDKLAAGLGVTYGRTRALQISSGTSTSRTNSVGLAPFVRFYLLPKDNRYNLVTEARYFYTWYTIKALGVDEGDHGNGFSVSAGPVLFLKPQLAVEFLVGYRRANRHFSLGNENTIQSSLGFQLHFGKKTKAGK